MARHFRELTIWQLADRLSTEVYRLIESGGARRDFEFRDQLRDAVSGISAQIADGFPRGGVDFARYLTYAEGCLTETENWLHDGVKRGHWTRDDLIAAPTLIRRLTPGIRDLIGYLLSAEGRERSREFLARRTRRKKVGRPKATGGS